MDIKLIELLIVCGSLLLIGMLISEILEWVQLIIPLTSNHHIFVPVFDYTDDNEPHSWKREFGRGERANQSSINIITSDSIVIEVSDPLKWIGYSIKPAAMTLINDGKTISVRCIWTNEFIPHIEEGPLKSSYNFHSIIFYWGACDNVGSEHAFDNVQYPLEMQLIHVEANLKSPNSVNNSEDMEDIAIISFFFECSEKDNYELENIASNLSAIADEKSTVSITPFNLDTFFPLFNNKFYTYNDSFKSLLLNGNVMRIIYPEPLNISRTQMNKFREIWSLNQYEIKNSQPIQTMNDRTVYFHE